MSKSLPNLLVIGGAHVDRLARLNAPHLAQTSNPAGISESVGGGSFNSARAAKRFNLNISILSARGGDAGAPLVEQAIEAASIVDLSSVHLDRTTPSYTAILQPDGELVTAIADMALYETSLPRSFKRAPVQKAAAAADAILCDANISSAGIASIFTEIAKDKPVFGLAISAGKVTRLSNFLPRFTCLFMNRFEAAALTGLNNDASVSDLARALSTLGLNRAVISDGGRPAIFLDSKTTQLIEPPQTKILDVTGAGDCLAGTMIAAMLSGVQFIDAAKLGMAAASITASRNGASPDISLAEIKALANSHLWKIT